MGLVNMAETWKPIAGYEGYYEVSNLAQVRSVDRTIRVETSGRKYDRFLAGNIMRQGVHPAGYKMVSLTKNGKMKAFLVHRLVAKAFIPNPDELPMVNHKDENKTNNLPYNLEWCTNDYNINYGTAKERRVQKIIGVLHEQEHKDKISSSLKKYYETHDSPTKGTMSEKRKRICQLTRHGELIAIHQSTESAARLSGDIEKRKNISACCNGRRGSAYGYVWLFENDYCHCGAKMLADTNGGNEDG